MSKRNTRRVKLSPKAPLAIVFLMIIIVIGILCAMLWVFVNDDLNRINNLNVAFIDEANINASLPIESDTVSDTPSSEPQPLLPVVDPFQTIVAESEAVEKSYFNDAIFIGDSISKGLKIYGVLPPGNVIADQNVGIPTLVSDKPAYTNTSGKKVSLFEAMNATGITPKKIYIMLGLNGLPHYNNEEHITYYYKIIDEIKKRYPDAIIYVESVTPITKGAEESYAKKKKEFTNKKINEFNDMIIKMCEEKNIYYISVREALVDENGELKAEMAAPDGVHFIKSGHEAMYQYFKTHTVPDIFNKNTSE